MQPYIFPYLGYFQLVNAVDDFVFYDDVNFIKQGWINRNNILINNTKTLFTIPIKKASSFTEIKDTEIHPQLYKKWKKKFLKSINQSYAKAPYFNEVYVLVEDVLNTDTTISELATNSVIKIFDYLGIQKKFYNSSNDFNETKGLNRADRLIEICKNLNADSYVNVKAGIELYDKSYFLKKGISLNFIENKFMTYPQLGDDFIEGLSIIDVLMFNTLDEVKMMLNDFKLN